MEERSNHLTVIIGASTLAEDLRRTLVKRGVAHAGISTHLRGLRRSLAIGEYDLVVLCIALDEQTVARHGRAIQKLLSDFRCIPQSIRSVGLLSQLGMTDDAASLGCDVYAHDTAQATKAVQLLARKWRAQRTAVRKAGTATRADLVNRTHSWTCGTPSLTNGFTDLIQASIQASAALLHEEISGSKDSPSSGKPLRRNAR